MRLVSGTVHVSICTFEELDPEDAELLRSAFRARFAAQAPYSHYHVGAAVRTEHGTTFSGCNVERCTFTQTTHAEQNAVDSAVAAHGPVKITSVAVVGGPAKQEIDIPPMVNGGAINSLTDAPVPCGHCLQVIWENCYGDAGTRLIVLAANGEVVVTTIGDAFPMRFGPEDVGNTDNE